MNYSFFQRAVPTATHIEALRAFSRIAIHLNLKHKELNIKLI